MKDQRHYLGLLDRNPRATVGFGLAAKMVVAARGGDVAETARRLRRTYGEILTGDETRAEMETKKETDVREESVKGLLGRMVRQAMETDTYEWTAADVAEFADWPVADVERHLKAAEIWGWAERVVERWGRSGNRPDFWAPSPRFWADELRRAEQHLDLRGDRA